MDESTNPQNVDEDQPSDVDSQAAEPRGRLGRSGDENASGGSDRPAKQDGAAESREAADSAGAPENHGTGDHLAAEQGDPAVQGRPHEGEREGRPPLGEEDSGEESHGSNRSFLLGLAWWP
ncbi:hypothetical protein AB0O34_29510 [Sphaerisporangium sp. NPDC088356]|uniref:hypothetical protein n=1 Tax=Sphaerisporangium sp. NPDC088356 TaxID=3154871 RepID=UPI003445A566